MAETIKVLIAPDRRSKPAEVVAEQINGHLVRVMGEVYHHTHEDAKGRWVYTPTK